MQNMPNTTFGQSFLYFLLFLCFSERWINATEVVPARSSFTAGKGNEPDTFSGTTGKYTATKRIFTVKLSSSFPQWRHWQDWHLYPHWYGAEPHGQRWDALSNLNKWICSLTFVNRNPRWRWSPFDNKA